MCLIVFNWQPDQPQWLSLAANRDEFHQRQAHALHAWQDGSGIIAGQDLQEGGTWMGISNGLRFAAVTNVRNGPAPNARRSRGHLVADYLRSHLSPQDYIHSLLGIASEFGRFNLLCGDRQQLWYVRNDPDVQAFPVTPGLHVLSNASLDSPWPKAQQAQQQLQEWLAQQAKNDSLQEDGLSLARLLDQRHIWPDEQLPDTGVPLDWERRLSAQFIIAPGYGTRSSGSLIGSNTGLHITEHIWNEAGDWQSSNQIQSL
jgi:uncharacterized protein with NRDE domain